MADFRGIAETGLMCCHFWRKQHRTPDGKRMCLMCIVRELRKARA